MSAICNNISLLYESSDEPSTDATLSSIMERHATTQSKKETTNSKNSKDKQRLLARYAEISDGEDSRYPFRHSIVDLSLLGFQSILVFLKAVDTIGNYS